MFFTHLQVPGLVPLDLFRNQCYSDVFMRPELRCCILWKPNSFWEVLWPAPRKDTLSTKKKHPGVLSSTLIFESRNTYPFYIRVGIRLIAIGITNVALSLSLSIYIYIYIYHSMHRQSRAEQSRTELGCFRAVIFECFFL